MKLDSIFKHQSHPQIAHSKLKSASLQVKKEVAQSLTRSHHSFLLTYHNNSRTRWKKIKSQSH